QVTPTEGDAELVLRQTRGDKEHKFPVGNSRGFAQMSFSQDNKWLAFTVSPPAKEAKAAAASGKPPQTKLMLLELATGNKAEFEKIRRFTFSGEASAWLAMHKQPAAGQSSGTDKWSGSDLILRELATGTELMLGNVADFAFDKKGQFLALAIDAVHQIGNGV